MLARSPAQDDLIDLALFCAMSVAFALVLQIFARLGSIHPHNHWHVTTYHWLSWPLIAAAVAMIAVCWRLFAQRRGSGVSSVLRERLHERYVPVTVGSFIGGAVIAAGVRFGLGYALVTDFATGSAPIVAALLVGIIVAGSRESTGFPWYRQLALMYLLLGSLATALGTLPANGWFLGTCFFLIFGGLSAATWLTIDIVLNSSPQVSEETSHFDARS
jgi:hypothetical protein